MANRYWVGGTANWDATAGTKWALTSGGTGGEPVPTTSDDVFFDAASGANTVTVNLANTSFAKSINCTGFTGTIAGTGTIGVAGSITLVAGMTYSHTGAVTITGTGTLTTAGKSFSNLDVSGSGITVTLGDALTLSTRNITVTQGTFDTANYNVTCGSLTSNSGLARTISLGSSTISISGSSAPLSFTSTNLTFNAGTSQINCTATGFFSFSGAGATFYNVSFTGGVTNSSTISGGNVFNNLSFTAPSIGISPINISANQTVNGTLTCSGASGVRRIWLRSDTLGLARTITAATCAPSDCDFRDITIAGAAAPISGTRLGDCGGNSGITFPAAKTVYWNPASATGFASTSAWAATSGGTTLSADNFPLAQDTAVVDNASRAGIGSNNDATWNIGTFDASSRTTAFSMSLGNRGLTIYKDWKFGTGVVPAGNDTLTFSGRATQTITTNGVSWQGSIAIATAGSTVTLADALAIANNLTLTSGVFDAVTYNVTAATCSISGSLSRTLNMGSGTWTLTSTGTVWNAQTITNLTFNKGTANIVLSNTGTGSRTFSGGGRTYNKLTIGGATGTSTLTFVGGNTFSELASTKTVAHTIVFPSGSTQTVGAWTITGTAGNVVTLQSSSTSSYTLNKTGGGTVSVDYMSISRSTATPGSTWYAGANSTDGGNNSGWNFTVPPPPAVGTFLMLF